MRVIGRIMGEVLHEKHTEKDRHERQSADPQEKRKTEEVNPLFTLRQIYASGNDAERIM